jgi:hypothetical protein
MNEKSGDDALEDFDARHITLDAIQCRGTADHRGAR